MNDIHSMNDQGRYRIAGWQGVALIAITYVYFLIFAQFGFLKRLADLHIAGDRLKAVMGAMALGGICTSLLASRLESFLSPAKRLGHAFAGCAGAALLSLLPMDASLAMLVSLLIGMTLGLVTVTLVTHLNLWIGRNAPVWRIGIGVGLAYFLCNYPPLFESSSEIMALVAAVICLSGMVLAHFTVSETSLNENIPYAIKPPPFLLILGCFTALVWLDSAAFYVIQNTPALKAGTWEGSRRLWQNGGVHFLAALGSACLLARRGLSTTITTAFICLGSACLLLMKSSTAALASIAYPAGVSLYSVALVAYPAYMSAQTSVRKRAVTAGVLYAVAGWTGSAMGIGMGENLHRIPFLFILAAALLFFTPGILRLIRQRPRELLALTALFSGAWILFQRASRNRDGIEEKTRSSLVEAGRQVYVSEGCINCHSQYIRPASYDDLFWGQATAAEKIRTETPPLIGNRRQGPDLSTVGNRRSPLWLRIHFIAPNLASYHSPMPSYAYLFTDERGKALLAYLHSLGATQKPPMDTWPPVAGNAGDALDGSRLLQQYCYTCHDTAGQIRQKWGKDFKRLPPDLTTGPFVYAPALASKKWRANRIAQIIKFGLPGTDMPGHEYLPDSEIAAMAQQIVWSNKTGHP